MRTHYCGLIRSAQIDETVTLCGWVDRRRDHGGVIFLDLRDREGIVQVVFDPDTQEHFETADRVRTEYVLKVTGRVRARGEGVRASSSASSSASRPSAPGPSTAAAAATAVAASVRPGPVSRARIQSRSTSGSARSSRADAHSTPPLVA